MEVETPFGAPAGPVRVGEVSGVRVGFLPRHGEGHRVDPTHVPYRANLFALKLLGARTVIGVTAVGSLRRRLAPGDLVLPDDLIDRTHGRARSFFAAGLVAHVGLVPAYCEQTRATLLAHASSAGRPVHDGGTLVVIEGPRFSTKAESRMHRAMGADLVGMTALPEAALAREAELPYVSLAVV